MEMKDVIIPGITGVLFLIALLHNNKWVVRCSVIGGLIVVGIFINDLRQAPNGLPPELKTDGLYEVRVVDVYTEKDGGQWVAIQILEEEGKTIEGRLPYRKIPKAKFGGNTNIVYGIPLTIELKTFPSQQYLTVK